MNSFGISGILRAIGALAIVTAVAFNAPLPALASHRGEPKTPADMTAHAIPHLERSAASASMPVLRVNKTDGTQGSLGGTVLNVDSPVPGAQISLYTFGTDLTYKVAFGNRFTLTSDQSPFAIKQVSAYIGANMFGEGFEIGENVGVTVFIDPASTGTIAEAALVYDGTYTLTQVNAEIVFELPTPIVIGQGDVYCIVTDLTTDLDDTFFPVVQTVDGGSTDPRALVKLNLNVAPDPTQNSGYLQLAILGVTGNVVVRAYGDPAIPGDDITGGGQTRSSALAAPTNAIAAAANQLTFSWTAPAIPTVQEFEPNDSPATAQAAPFGRIINANVSTSDPGTDIGAGKFEDWYSLSLGATGSVTVDLVDDGGVDLDLYLYPKNGPFSTPIAQAAGDCGAHEIFSDVQLQPGDYVVAVDAFDNPNCAAINATPYQLEIIGPNGNRLTGYNVYRGPSEIFPINADSYFGTTGPHTTSLVVHEHANGTYYRVSAVYGSQQSLPTRGVTAALVLGIDTAGVVNASTGAFFLKNANAPGAADIVFSYGPGDPTWKVLSGDWDGDGRDSIGLYDPATGAFFLKNSNAPGPADIVVNFGPGGTDFVPLVADWDGNGTDTIGIYSQATGVFYLKYSNTPGSADVVVGFGAGGAGYVPICGDWDGDGDDSIGLYLPASGTFFLKNVNVPGPADTTFSYGPSGLAPLVGDWNSDNVDTVGVFSSQTAAWFLRNSNTPGVANIVFNYGPAGAAPLAGDWDGQ